MVRLVAFLRPLFLTHGTNTSRRRRRRRRGIGEGGYYFSFEYNQVYCPHGKAPHTDISRRLERYGDQNINSS